MIYEKLKLNPKNPRTIKKEALEKLKKSIKEFPEMLEKRPIVYDEDFVILGGNMRFKALKELVEKGFEVKDTYFLSAEGWSEDKKRTFVIKDNLEVGEWDVDVLMSDWSDLPLEEWGIKLRETEKLSDLKFNDIYYQPKNKPNINLNDCLILDKYKEKLKVIEESNLSDDKKELLKMFAHRFIKIDFQSVADYYYFNADEEEKAVIERLRLVLCDSGLDGFIEDHLLRMIDQLEDWEEQKDD